MPSMPPDAGQQQQQQQQHQHPHVAGSRRGTANAVTTRQSNLKAFLLLGLSLTVIFIQSVLLDQQLSARVDHALAETQMTQQRLIHRQQDQWEKTIGEQLRELARNQGILQDQWKESITELQETTNTASNNHQRRIEQLVGVLEEQKSLLERVAPAFFPIDPQTGKIQFPDEVQTVLIDIGAKEPSYFLDMVVAAQDPTVALLLFDPLYDGYVPIAKRALEYTLQQSNPEGDYIDSPNTVKRVFAMQAAIGPAEGHVEFRLSQSAFCGTISKHKDYFDTSSESEGCKKEIGRVRAIVFTLSDVLKLLPDDRENLHVHIKMDAEGVDDEIVQEAAASSTGSSALHRVETIIAEKNLNQDARDNLLCQHAGLCLHASSCCDTIYWRQGYDRNSLPAMFKEDANNNNDANRKLRNSTLEFRQVFRLVQ